MDTIKFAEQCLNEVHERLIGSIKGLSQEDLSWRPATHANSTGEILWHLARTEDRMLRPNAVLGPEVWESQDLYHLFGYPKDSYPGVDPTFPATQGLPEPRLEHLLAYIEMVHQDTLEKLHSLSPDDLDRVPNPDLPQRSVSSYFRHLIIHNNNHHGQLDYIRGLMNQEWELTPGTGIIQP